MATDKTTRIMQAAEELFRTRQFHEITLDEIAKQADIGKGTIYLHFADKDDLFFQTAVAGFDELCDLVAKSPFDGLPFPKVLLQTCERISGFFRQRRPLFRIIRNEDERTLGVGGSLRQRWIKRRKELTAAMAVIIERGVASGHIRKDIPAPVLAEYLLGMLRTRALEMDDTPEAQRTLAPLTDLFIQGAMQRQGSSTRTTKGTRINTRRDDSASSEKPRHLSP
jgi:AcrR family transcriptional regulator